MQPLVCVEIYMFYIHVNMLIFRIHVHFGLGDRNNNLIILCCLF